LDCEEGGNKFLLNSSEPLILHGFTFQKMVRSIVTGLITSNPISIFKFQRFASTIEAARTVTVKTVVFWLTVLFVIRADWAFPA
jgi:hypothetical protein